MMQRRRWAVVASGLLCLMLALVVLYTNRGAFFSPLAVVVVAAIGLAAVLAQARFYNPDRRVQGPVWLNVVGVGFALPALFGDSLHFTPAIALVMALCAVGCFAVSSAILLRSFRKHDAA